MVAAPRILGDRLHQAMAQVEWSRRDYDSSLSHFEKAVELDALPDQQHFSLMYQIAQLYFLKDRYDDALGALDLWFCKVAEESITSHAWVLKASINAQKQDFRETLKAIEVAIGMEEEPKEAWYQLKLASHFELQQFPEVATTLELMVSKWPEKKTYWMQLSQIYYKLEQEDKALATMALEERVSKTLAWYDNGWGYANRVIDLIRRFQRIDKEAA